MTTTTSTTGPDFQGRLRAIIEDLQRADFQDPRWFFLLTRAQELSLVSGFENLLSLDDLNIVLYPHQERAVKNVLQNMGGSALLADEVGLGKTIIACTILSELRIRNLVNKVLIAVPPSLVGQWQQELDEKFNMDVPIVASGIDDWSHDQFITSINLIVLNPEKVLDRAWDLVILDEAHRVKNRKSKTWGVLNRLQKKYILSLTATPMENYLSDIYGIVTLLKPGLFGTYRQFRKKYAIPGNKRGCKDPLALRRGLNTVMIRRRRGDVRGIFFPERVARTIQFPLSSAERAFYDQLSEYVITSYAELENYKQRETKQKIVSKYGIASQRFFKRKIWLHKFTLMLLQRRICSSAIAAQRTLATMVEARESRGFDQESLPLLHELLETARALAGQESSKNRQLKTILAQLPTKAVLFTEFQDSLDYLEQFLTKHEIPFLKFHGGLSSTKRAEVVQAFEESDVPVLISTDAGSEGLNLQVANTVINYDLPWNPMRIEQRIGRVYRLTQQSEQVYIFNLASENTIEAYVLDLCLEKIGIFRTILGDLDHLLGTMLKVNADGRSSRFESEIMSFFIKHGHSEKLRKDLEALVAPVVDQVELQDEVSRTVLDVDEVVETY